MGGASGGSHAGLLVDMKVTLALTLSGKSLRGSEQKDDETQHNTKGAFRLLDGNQTEGKESRWR